MKHLEGQFIYPFVRDSPNLAGQLIMVNPHSQGQQQKQYVIVAPAPVQYTETNKKANHYAKYKKGESIAIGVMQILMGLSLLGINVGIILTNPDKNKWMIGIGTWGALIVIVAGTFGIAAGTRPTNRRVELTAALSVLLCGIVIGILVEGLPQVIHRPRCAEETCNPHSELAQSILASIFVVFGVGEFFFALAQSILCFRVLVSKPKAQPDHVVVFDNGGYEPHYDQAQSPPDNAVPPYSPPIDGATGYSSKTDGATGGMPGINPPAYNPALHYRNESEKSPTRALQPYVPLEPSPVGPYGNTVGNTCGNTGGITGGSTGGNTGCAPEIVVPAYHLQFGNESAKFQREGIPDVATQNGGEVVSAEQAEPTVPSSPVASAPPVSEPGPGPP